MISKLDGRKMASREDVHDYLRDKLGLSSYYGKNLDALWDELTTIDGPRTIRISHGDLIRKGLGPYGNRLLETFTDAAKENKNLRVKIKKWHYL